MLQDFTRGATKDEFTINVDAVPHGSVSIAILRIVSAYTDRPINELPPLGEKVSPEALDDLLHPVLPDPEVAHTQVSFRYCGFHITVSATGEIQLRPVGDHS